VTREQRGDRLAELIEEVKPWGGWQSASDMDRWALVTAAGSDDDGDTQVRWLRTFDRRHGVEQYVRNDLVGGELPVLLVELDTGMRLVPGLHWVPDVCTWPTCHQPPASDGRLFLGGAMCSMHTAESYERDAAARADIDAERTCSR
jgi:hypothetical protein